MNTKILFLPKVEKMKEPIIMNNLFFTITLIGIGLFAIAAAVMGSLFVSVVGIGIVAAILLNHSRDYK